jgi:hypothetical protein
MISGNRWQALHRILVIFIKPTPLINHLGNKLKGTPTSRVYFCGPVKGIRDFIKVEPSSVLVIPYSELHVMYINK